MMLLYNSSTHTYTNIVDYLESIEIEEGTSYRLLLLYNLDELFAATKKRTAWRGRFARSEQGGRQLDNFALTDDDRDMFDDLMKNGSGEVFRKLSAWAKTIPGAYRHNVKFGSPVAAGSVVSGGTTVTLTDTAQALTVNELAGYKLVITSPGLAMNQEKTIVSNTADTITLDTAFAVDVTAMDFAVFTQTDDFIIFYLYMEATWDINMLMAASEAAREALVTYFVKEWYVTNRYVEDANIEAARYNSELAKIRQSLSQRKTTYRRSGEILS